MTVSVRQNQTKNDQMGTIGFITRLPCHITTCKVLYLVFTRKTFSVTFLVNNNNTEMFAIGRHSLAQTNFLHKKQTSIKILGVYFDDNVALKIHKF